VCLVADCYRSQDLDSPAVEHGIISDRCLLEQLLDPFIIKNLMPLRELDQVLEIGWTRRVSI
jgi:hypothetical protein